MESLNSIIEALLHFLNYSVGNWGLAVLCFAFLVRVMLIPIQIFNFRQRRLLLKVQPALDELATRYKNDPMSLFQKSGEIKKNAGVKVGLTLLSSLLQMPIFISVYRVFSTLQALSIGSFAWFVTLGAPDPLFILPALVALTSYAQLKSGTTTQFLRLMPLLSFTFMVAMPSGLVLYYAMSGVLQCAGDQLLKRFG